MRRRNRRESAGPTRQAQWPADLRPLLKPYGLAREAVLADRAGECRWTGKTRYPDEHAARTALVGAVITHNRGQSQRREQRAYQCVFPGCRGGWHLTSLRMPPEPPGVPAPRQPSDPAVSGPVASIGSSQPTARSQP